MRITIDNEIRLLYRAEAELKVLAAPVIRQLTAEIDRPLPDLLPPMPPRREFHWPASGLTPQYKDYPPLWPD